MPRERADDGSRIRVPDIHMGNLCCVLGSWLWPGPVLIDGSFAKWTNGCKISVCLSIKLNCIKLKCKIFLFFIAFQLVVALETAMNMLPFIYCTVSMSTLFSPFPFEFSVTSWSLFHTEDSLNSWLITIVFWCLEGCGVLIQDAHSVMT